MITRSTIVSGGKRMLMKSAHTPEDVTRLKEAYEAFQAVAIEGVARYIASRDGDDSLDVLVEIPPEMEPLSDVIDDAEIDRHDIIRQVELIAERLKAAGHRDAAFEVDDVMVDRTTGRVLVTGLTHGARSQAVKALRRKLGLSRRMGRGPAAVVILAIIGIIAAVSIIISRQEASTEPLGRMDDPLDSIIASLPVEAEKPAENASDEADSLLRPTDPSLAIGLAEGAGIEEDDELNGPLAQFEEEVGAQARTTITRLNHVADSLMRRETISQRDINAYRAAMARTVKEGLNIENYRMAYPRVPDAKLSVVLQSAMTEVDKALQANEARLLEKSRQQQ